ncbi:hypothetical protein QYF61_026021 [Mycteria americana]|uniref:Uncharacterized protein n=1 Tax=Mycteria americana TaxID=33587 RepID=A0AAN7NLW2_MYCAM|nr:hypothetical protein QYF61_026021 [Mycteria americana]
MLNAYEVPMPSGRVWENEVLLMAEEDQVTCNVRGKLTRPLGSESCDQELEFQLDWLDQILVVFLRGR